jgi:hypothetical protein
MQFLQSKSKLDTLALFNQMKGEKTTINPGWNKNKITIPPKWLQSRSILGDRNKQHWSSSVVFMDSRNIKIKRIPVIYPLECPTSNPDPRTHPHLFPSSLFPASFISTARDFNRVSVIINSVVILCSTSSDITYTIWFLNMNHHEPSCKPSIRISRKWANPLSNLLHEEENRVLLVLQTF